MKYNNIVEGIFIDRPNRFIANVEIDGKIETCHVKNTGRCREILRRGVKVFLEENDNPNRKTKFSLISAFKENKLINIDSQVPNKIVHEWLLKETLIKNITLIKPEKTYKDSRFDFYVETIDKKIFIEVKGATLEENGIVRFPDAPTERGVKHIKELTASLKDGYEAYIIFVIQMKGVLYFEPNIKMHKEFGDELKKASKKGVNVIAVDCNIARDEINIDDFVDVSL